MDVVGRMAQLRMTFKFDPHQFGLGFHLGLRVSGVAQHQNGPREDFDHSQIDGDLPYDSQLQSVCRHHSDKQAQSKIFQWS